MELDKIQVLMTEFLCGNRVGFFRKQQWGGFFQLQPKNKGKKECFSQQRDNYQFKHIKDPTVTFYNIES